MAQQSDLFELPSDDLSRRRARQNVGSLIEFNRRHVEIVHAAVEERAIRSVGIIGAGTMGALIAASTVEHELRVVITDACENVLADLPAKVAAELAQRGAIPEGERPVFTARESGQSASRVSSNPEAACDRFVELFEATVDLAAIGQCDLVLETVVEDPSVKQQVFADLEPNLGPHVILTSNTSTIPLGRLAAELDDPGRFCGTHFFLPIRERPLVEIVRGRESRDSTVAAAVAYVEAIGRIPLIVNDGPGFLVNRLMLPYVSEAMQLLLEGARIEAIERAGTSFGMALGPLRLLDETGLDTALNCGWVLAGAYPETVATSPLLVAMVKAGRLGRKSGAGFFAYSDPAGSPVSAKVDPAVDEIIARWAQPPVPHTQETIAARLFLPMVLEATRILEEEVVSDPRFLDLGVIFGLGFPQARGGLLFWADTLGARQILEMLRPLEPLGPRARPTPMLRETAEKNGRFYEDGV